MSARLRTRGSILVVWGDWPRCDARLGLTDVEWHGAGWGNGHLKARQAKLVLYGAQRPVLQVFEAVALSKIIPICSEESEALAAVGEQP